MRNCREGSFAERRLPLHSAFRVPHSALDSLAFLALVLIPVPGRAQQWPVNSLDRPYTAAAAPSA